jgi:hypothetical protein
MDMAIHDGAMVAPARGPQQAGFAVQQEMPHSAQQRHGMRRLHQFEVSTALPYRRREVHRR